MRYYNGHAPQLGNFGIANPITALKNQLLAGQKKMQELLGITKRMQAERVQLAKENLALKQKVADLQGQLSRTQAGAQAAVTTAVQAAQMTTARAAQAPAMDPSDAASVGSQAGQVVAQAAAAAANRAMQPPRVRRPPPRQQVATDAQAPMPSANASQDFPSQEEAGVPEMGNDAGIPESFSPPISPPSDDAPVGSEDQLGKLADLGLLEDEDSVMGSFFGR